MLPEVMPLSGLTFLTCTHFDPDYFLYFRENYWRDHNQNGKRDPAEFIREELNNRINLRQVVHDELDRLKASGLSKDKLGPMVAGVYDPKTGKYYFGINHSTGQLPDNLHPILNERYLNMPEEILNSYNKFTKGAGSHAEIYALNQALWAREQAGISIDSLDDFYINVISARKLGKKVPVAGMPVPRCPHCEYLTQGSYFYPEVYKMEKIILNKGEVIKKGVNFEELVFEYCSDRILNADEEDGGKPYSGLSYELYENGNLEYYCYYVNGFKQGDNVEFYEDGSIKAINEMKRGVVLKSIEWYKNKNIKKESTYKCGICLTYKEWSDDGKLIDEKKSPTKSEEELIKKLSII